MDSTAYIKDFVRRRPHSVATLRETKRELAAQYKTTILPNSVILGYYKQAYKQSQRDDDLLRLLRKRAIRTLSGIAPVTVLTKPYPCPGRCSYCPTEARMPKSYIASEPAAQRALRLKFDPWEQMTQRIQAFEANGHSVDKIELIVLGGTWSYYTKRYQTWFIKRLFDGANGRTVKTLAEAQRINETAKHRIIGLTLETRPDYVTKEELLRMRKLGCTHVQIGVQTLDQDVLDLIKRDDSVANIARATAMLRDFGFKITYHLMPGLPGATPAKDFKVFQRVFSELGFQPDMLKIYPCVVIKSAEIYKWHKEGKYKPYTGKKLSNLIIKIKKEVIPPYVRINRLIRDIPGNEIEAGNLVTNLRQLLQQQGVECKCIRCREVRQQKIDERDAFLSTITYQAGQGEEHFISFASKDQKQLFAFTRLRLPKIKNRTTEKLTVIRFFDQKKITVQSNDLAFPPDTALIRELHTYGELIPIGGRVKKAVQHRGFGKRLMREAERVAKEAGYTQLAVISGIGVRGYYRKLGYRLKDTYMVKSL